MKGVPVEVSRETCTACAGSMIDLRNGSAVKIDRGVNFRGTVISYSSS